MLKFSLLPTVLQIQNINNYIPNSQTQLENSFLSCAVYLDILDRAKWTSFGVAIYSRTSLVLSQFRARLIVLKSVTLRTEDLSQSPNYCSTYVSLYELLFHNGSQFFPNVDWSRWPFYTVKVKWLDLSNVKPVSSKQMWNLQTPTVCSIASKLTLDSCSILTLLTPYYFFRIFYPILLFFFNIISRVVVVFQNLY